MKIIALGADHGGYQLKERIKLFLASRSVRLLDYGTNDSNPCDYPIIGAQVARAVWRRRAQAGVLICKSGNGIAMVANKFPRVRAAICHTPRSAQLARRHNHANILVLGASHLTWPQARAIVDLFFKTPVDGGRHRRRVRQIHQIERQVTHSIQKRRGRKPR